VWAVGVVVVGLEEDCGPARGAARRRSDPPVRPEIAGDRGRACRSPRRVAASAGRGPRGLPGGARPPACRALLRRLRDAGTPPTVALVACRRKLLTIATAILCDGLP